MWLWSGNDKQAGSYRQWTRQEISEQATAILSEQVLTQHENLGTNTFLILETCGCHMRWNFHNLIPCKTITSAGLIFLFLDRITIIWRSQNWNSQYQYQYQYRKRSVCHTQHKLYHLCPVCTVQPQEWISKLCLAPCNMGHDCFPWYVYHDNIAFSSSGRESFGTESRESGGVWTGKYVYAMQRHVWKCIFSFYRRSSSPRSNLYICTVVHVLNNVFQSAHICWRRC